MISPEVLSFERDAIAQAQGFLPPVDQNLDYSSEIQTMAEVELAELKKWGLEQDFKETTSLVVQLRQQFLQNIAGSFSLQDTMDELKNQLLELASSTQSGRTVKKEAWQTIRCWLRNQVSIISLSMIAQKQLTGTEPEIQEHLKQQNAFFKIDLPEKLSVLPNIRALTKTLRAIQLSRLPAISQAA